ncbi:uncharacterized protein [Argopecten irradians]|uniref:uncharacterized protein n=1 Tax=Argopecten irradians TaxID=31199 RepID=UPI003718CC29
MLWLRITKLSLFGVTSLKFVVNITGQGIECGRVGQKSLQIGTSGPTHNAKCRMKSDMVFCNLVSTTIVATKTKCTIQCTCTTLSECRERRPAPPGKRLRRTPADPTITNNLNEGIRGDEVSNNVNVHEDQVTVEEKISSQTQGRVGFNPAGDTGAVDRVMGSTHCVVNGTAYCSQFKICTGDVDMALHPGMVKTLLYEFYVLQGLIGNTSVLLTTPRDMSVTHLDANMIAVTTGNYQPIMTKVGPVAQFSNEGVFYFGNVPCDGVASNATDKACAHCLVTISVDYLMADVTGIQNNATRDVTATLVTEDESLMISSSLVLFPIHITSLESSFSILAHDQEFPVNSIKRLVVELMLPNPLSSYLLELASYDPLLRIASARGLRAGENYKDILSTKTELNSSSTLCHGGDQFVILDFGYLPSKGTSGEDLANTIDVEVSLMLAQSAPEGELFGLNIFLLENQVGSMRATQNFTAVSEISLQNIVITTNQSGQILSKNGKGTAMMTLHVPKLLMKTFKISTSIRLYSGEGVDNGLVVLGIRGGGGGDNIPCINKTLHWKGESGAVQIVNIAYNDDIQDSFNFNVLVVAVSDRVEENSSFELSVGIIYDGPKSAQYFNFYFNISDNERYMTSPISSGFLRSCSVTHVQTFRYELKTTLGSSYGSFELILSSGEIFAICAVSEVTVGYNIFVRTNTTIIRGDNETIERVIITFSSLENLHLDDSNVHDTGGIDYVFVYMAVAFVNTSMGMTGETQPFYIHMTSNGNVIGSTHIDLEKPAIKYYEDFIVVTAVETTTTVSQTNLIYYSINGTYFYRKALQWTANDMILDFLWSSTTFTSSPMPAFGRVLPLCFYL